MSRKLRIVFLIFTFFTLITVLGIAVCPLFERGGEPVRIVIRKGEGASQVVRTLVDSGVVSHPNVLMFWLKVTGRDRHIRAGVYEFRRRSGVVTVWWILSRGPNAKSIMVTIPEGLTLKQIAGIVARKIGNDSLRFVQLATDRLFVMRMAQKYGFPPPPSLEGYLFPDSYKFSYFEDESSIIDRMVGQLMAVLKREGLLYKMERKGLKLHTVLTLASIVEREAAVDSERPIIAAVFWNRLKRGMPLESCATVEYVLPRHKTRLTYDDLRVQSPYNTYLHPGLPPGPICSPGLKSIKAVVEPANVPYLYFVAKGDGTHFFASTYSQHVRNKAIARRLRRKS